MSARGSSGGNIKMENLNFSCAVLELNFDSKKRLTKSHCSDLLDTAAHYMI